MLDDVASTLRFVVGIRQKKNTRKESKAARRSPNLKTHSAAAESNTTAAPSYAGGGTARYSATLSFAGPP